MLSLSEAFTCRAECGVDVVLMYEHFVGAGFLYVFVQQFAALLLRT